MNNQQQEVYGICEYIDFPELNLKHILAKTDTGAYSGALHCTDINEIDSGSDGEKILQFKVLGDDNIIHQVYKYKKTYITSATGHRVRRYLITTKAIIKNKQYDIVIGLSDRSSMEYEVLLGRRFLIDNKILIDLNINKELDKDRSKKK